MGYEFAEPVALPKGSKLQFDHPFRQLAGQPLQPRSDEEGRVGPAELGRDEQLLHRRAVPTGTAPEKVFLRSGPSLLPRGESGPTLAAFSLVDPNAVAKASNASSGGREESDK